MFAAQLVVLYLLLTVAICALLRAWSMPAATARAEWLRRGVIVAVLLATMPLVVAGRWLFFPFGLMGSCDIPSRLETVRHRSFAYDRHGRALGALDERIGGYVQYDRMAPGVPETFAAAEDRRVFAHDGVDARGVLRAVYRGIVGHRREGASTIHMQLVRTLCQTVMPRDGTWTGKLSEAAAAIRLAREVDPRRVVEAYANTVYLGRNRWGIDAAARTYFGLRAEDLTIAEAAQLAALIRSPRRLDPVVLGSDGARTERQRVLALAASSFPAMRSRFEAAMQQPTRLGGGDARMRTGVAEYLAAVRTVTDAVAGDSVATALDLDLQDAAEHVVSELLAAVENGRFGRYIVDPSARLEAIFLAMDFRTGDVLAYLPARPGALAEYDRIRDGRVLWSSTLKPIVYAFNLEAGRVSPSERIRDVIARTDVDLKDRWVRSLVGHCDVNRSVDEGIAKSDNCLAVAQFDLLGAADRDRLRGLGVDLTGSVGLVNALGIRAEPPLTILRLYAAIANEGRLVTPRFGARMPVSGIIPDSTDVWSPSTARLVALALRAVVERGTARAAASRLVSVPGAAGKTGTADNGAELLFVGSNATYTSLLWIGHDRRRAIVPQATAGDVVAKAWADVIVRHSRDDRQSPVRQVRSAW